MPTESDADLGPNDQQAAQMVTAGAMVASIKQKQLQDGFKIRIAHDDGKQLVITPSRGGYRLVAWWDSGNSSTQYIRFGSQPSSYREDNTHDREPTVDSENDTIVITDPDPRAAWAGYTPATLKTTFESEGFVATLVWEGEHGEEQSEEMIAPFVQPADDPERYDALIGQYLG